MYTEDAHIHIQTLQTCEFANLNVEITDSVQCHTLTRIIHLYS